MLSSHRASGPRAGGTVRSIIAAALLLAAGARAQGDLDAVKAQIDAATTPRTRTAAIAGLRPHQTAAARQLLLSLLDRHRDAETQIAVYRELERHAHASVVKRLTADFARQTDAAVLEATAQALGGQGKKGVAALLKFLRQGTGPAVRAAVAGLKPHASDDAVGAALVKSFDRADLATRRALLAAFAGIDDKALLSRVYCRILATDKDATLRSTALRGLRTCPGKAALQALTRELTTGRNGQHQRDAAVSLTGHGKAGVAALVGALASESDAVRSAAVHGLTRAEKDWNTVRALIEAFDAASAREQESILAALAGAEDSRALSEMRERALDSKTTGVRAEALRQLADAGHRKTRSAARRLAADPAMRRSSSDRGRVLYALGKVLDAELVPLFLQLARPPDTVILSWAGPLLANEGSEVVRLLGTVALESIDVAERVTAVELLACKSTKATSRYLLAALGDAAPEVMELATRALVKRKDRRIVDRLRNALGSDEEDVRLRAMLALHEFEKGSPSWPRRLLEILRDGRGAIRFHALDLLAELGHKGALPIAHAMFQEATWQARSAAYLFCGRVRDRASIPLLIDRLGKEDGRLRAEVLGALHRLSLMTYREEGQWRQWWDAVKDGFVLPPAPPDSRGPASPDVMTYYSLPLTSKRVCFVVDTSGSMKERVGTSRITRLDAAKEALNNVVERCAPDFHFNLLPFADGGRAWKVQLTPATGENKASAREFVGRLRAAGGTNLYDALRQAFEDPEVDTIYVLSDGEPSTGRITNPDELAAEVRSWNLKRRILIHAISIGTDSRLMQSLAADSNGTYVRRI